MISNEFEQNILQKDYNVVVNNNNRLEMLKLYLFEIHSIHYKFV